MTSQRNGAPMRAVVLGGGTVGVAWQTGLLAGLREAGIELVGASAIVGTSAGALVGALLSSDRDVTDAPGRPRGSRAEGRLREPDGRLGKLPERIAPSRPRRRPAASATSDRRCGTAGDDHAHRRRLPRPARHIRRCHLAGRPQQRRDANEADEARCRSDHQFRHEASVAGALNPAVLLRLAADDFGYQLAEGSVDLCSLGYQTGGR